MGTQSAIFDGNQHANENLQERELTLQEEATGKRINELETEKSTNAAYVSHHSSCCCISCWSKNMDTYL